MKSIFALITFFLLSITIHSQINSNRFLLSGRVSRGIMEKKPYTTYGLSFEYIIKNKLGLVYNVDGISSENGFSLHSPMGLSGGSLLIYAGLASMTDGDPETSGAYGLIGGLILLTLPDGICYHHNIGYYWDVSPYANLLGVDIVFDKKHQFDALKYACSFGVKTSYLISDNLFCFGYVETRKTGDFPWGVGAGGGLGMTFKHKGETNQMNPNQQK